MTERACATASRAASEAADSAAATSSTLGSAVSDEAGACSGATDALAIEPPASSSAAARARSNYFAKLNTCWTDSSRMRSTIAWNI